jgi:chaperone modulatory protein CbpM
MADEMADDSRLVIDCVVVEEELRFTLADLCRACGAERSQLVALVDEGVIEPAGGPPEDWTFGGNSLLRARTAVRLERDFGIGMAGAALVLDLLDEIETLRARLRRAGML